VWDEYSYMTFRMNHVTILEYSYLFQGETATGFENGHWAHWGNAQHISMFLFFGKKEIILQGKSVKKYAIRSYFVITGFTGVVDVLYFYKVDLPPGLDYAAAFLAFSIEGFLFGNHLHGRSHMDVMVRSSM
jgi:hypothetical protein